MAFPPISIFDLAPIFRTPGSGFRCGYFRRSDPHGEAAGVTAFPLDRPLTVVPPLVFVV